ncbi:glutathione S-transferase N-terminal domain-containing protein [Paraburkholderia largidicola]|uniref:Thiol:disulfide oxidoreductase n=1 Tax=Paraburkholderia largidicola TaxID=3014751 RepID=A0A7I8C206_9BURK|nr:glutathione S-transferase N-terminal domain-containing protein [Paraburkholderia sp. PGU16]BCF95054.1 thiol:disulfide oxidoreductase [Paraburkholderia sp. PGU16]
MIDLYSWATPNGQKVHILLEELGLEYTAHPVNIEAGDQFSNDFLAISPNNKIPAITDTEGPPRGDGRPFSLFESGAILLYLAEKAGRFLPADATSRYEVYQWLMFQVGSIGPMLGQAHHFRVYAPAPIQYAISRYTNEARRLYSVMDSKLRMTNFLAGDEYTIVDIATFPWTRQWKNQGLELEEFPNVRRWHHEIAMRPAVERGVQVLTSVRPAQMDQSAREVLFGATQFARR